MTMDPPAINRLHTMIWHVKRGEPLDDKMAAEIRTAALRAIIDGDATEVATALVEIVGWSPLDGDPE